MNRTPSKKKIWQELKELEKDLEQLKIKKEEIKVKAIELQEFHNETKKSMYQMERVINEIREAIA